MNEFDNDSDSRRGSTGIKRRDVLKTTAFATGSLAFGGLGLAAIPGRATAIETCGVDLDVVLAIDYSGSINNAGTWDDIATGTKDFIDALAPDNQVGIVTFGDAPKAYDFGDRDYLVAADGNRTTVKGTVPTQEPPGENATHMPGALDLAGDILDTQGRGGKEVIVLLTDGDPNYQNGLVGDGEAPPNDDSDGTVGGVSGYVPSESAGFDPDKDDSRNTYLYEEGSDTENAVISQGEKDETEAVGTAVKADGTRIIAVDIDAAGEENPYLRNDIASSSDDYVLTDAGSIGEELVALLEEICCVPCETGDTLLEKYEFVEYEEGCEFVREMDKGDVEEIWYESGSFTSKMDEECEPISVTFETTYCEIDALVKAGRETYAFRDLVPDEDGRITIDLTELDLEKLHAISNVQFYCDAPEAPEHPGKGKGKGRGRGR